MKFEYLEHTADVKFRAYGKSVEKVFENSGLALVRSITKQRIRKRIKKEFIVKGKDLESLMYNFLEELLFLFDTSGFVFAKCRKIKIDLEKFKLETEVIGDLVGRYKFFSEIKAITYQEMFVEKVGKKWEAQVVLDV